MTRPALTRPALTRLAATGALLLAAAGCSGDGGSSAPDASVAPAPSRAEAGGVSEQERADLLQRLGQVDPALESGRSVGRARNVCIGVRRGLPEQELIATVRDRFTDVPLDDAQAAQVLTAVREALCP